MHHPLQVVSFATELGWIAMLGAGATIKQVVFAYPSRAAAWHALDPQLAADAQPGNWWPSLVERLRDYTLGRRVDFSDVAIDLAHLTPFQRRVVKQCRAIGYGKTRSYGELAARCGSPGAARAVGNTMAANRYALIVPCHRVIRTDGSFSGYRWGIDRKRQLLRTEGAA